MKLLEWRRRSRKPRTEHDPGGLAASEGLTKPVDKPRARYRSLCLPMVRPLCIEALLGLFRATLVQFCIRRVDHLIRRLLIVNEFLKFR
jgi:hypothetical protein